MSPIFNKASAALSFSSKELKLRLVLLQILVEGSCEPGEVQQKPSNDSARTQE